MQTLSSTAASPLPSTESLNEFEAKSAEEIVGWAAKTFGTDGALASSFGAEDMVLVDMICRVEPRITIFTLDTGRLPEETYRLIDNTSEKYGVTIQVYFPDAKKVEEMVNFHGMNLFYDSIDNRKMCCGIRKVEPLNRALSGKRAWLTGLRRDQTFTRTDTAKVARDPDHRGILKVSPLADWNSVASPAHAQSAKVKILELAAGGGNKARPRSAAFTPNPISIFATVTPKYPCGMKRRGYKASCQKS
jgi:phosphoadenosine phosphosulfate reductase